MQGDALLVILVLGLGIAAFGFGVVYVVCQFLSWIGRGVIGIFRPHRVHSSGGPGSIRKGRVCPREGCGKVEYRDARFCSQCGMPMT